MSKVKKLSYFFKWVNPGLFYRLFSDLFKQTTLQLLQQIYVKIVHPVYGAGIRIPQLLEHESSPLTTRPGLPPLLYFRISKRKSHCEAQGGRPGQVVKGEDSLSGGRECPSHRRILDGQRFTISNLL